MRVPIITYKNSKAANVFSILGTILCVIGVLSLRANIALSLIFIACGLALIFLVYFAMEQKKKKDRKKFLENPELISIIRSSSINAFELYKRMPEDDTLDCIRKHNPFAAEKISKMIDGTGNANYIIREMIAHDAEQQALNISDKPMDQRITENYNNTIGIKNTPTEYTVMTKNNPDIPVLKNENNESTKKQYGLASLILGIISLFFSITGIPGLVLGIIAVNKNKRAEKKQGLAVAGIILSSIGTVIFLVFLTIIIFSAPAERTLHEVSELPGFLVDINSKGSITEKAEDVTSKNVIIDNKSYQFPVAISKMIDNGWHIQNSTYDNIKSNSITNIIGDLIMTTDDGHELYVQSVINKTNNSTRLENCFMQSFIIKCTPDNNETSFVFPGGINEKSTAHDILAVYGDPNDSPYFDHGLYKSNSLEYTWCNFSHYHYTFYFNEDGSMEHVHFSANAYD